MAVEFNVRSMALRIFFTAFGGFVSESLCVRVCACVCVCVRERVCV